MASLSTYHVVSVALDDNFVRSSNLKKCMVYIVNTNYNKLITTEMTGIVIGITTSTTCCCLKLVNNVTMVDFLKD